NNKPASSTTDNGQQTTDDHEVQSSKQENAGDDAPAAVIGRSDGMLRGFESIFGEPKRVHIVVSEESATYRPEMEWLAERLPGSKFKVQSSKFTDFAPGDAVYRFFELFDLANVE